MNCKTCNYALWRNTTGKCPECGTPFKPSDFEFVPGSVRFCCPHCAQQYFGTDSRGQLEPRAFTCVKCLQPIDIDQMVLMPEHGVPEAATVKDHLPLTDDSLGIFKRWWGTVSMALIAPHRLGSAINPAQGTAAAWIFAWINNLLVTLCSFGVFLVIFPLLMLAIPKGTPGLPPGMMGGMALGLGGFALGVGLIVYPIYIALWGLAVHLILHIGVAKPAYSLRHTYATLCLSSGANAINMIPCLGMYSVVGTIWWLVSATIAIRFSQRVSGVKAACAVIIPPVIVIGTCFSTYMGFVFYMVSKAPALAAAAQASQAGVHEQMMTDRIAQALIARKSVSAAWPNHIASLVLANELSSIDFSLPGSGSTPEQIQLGGTTLSAAVFLPKSEERRLTTALNASTPPPIYRFGDFVFVYQGVPAKPAGAPDTSKDLWIVIASPDPKAPPPPRRVGPFGAQMPTLPPPQTASIYVSTSDGTTKAIPASSFPYELAQQNALRATFGLPPIPSPETVPQWNLPAAEAPK